MLFMFHIIEYIIANNEYWALNEHQNMWHNIKFKCDWFQNFNLLLAVIIILVSYASSLFHTIIMLCFHHNSPEHYVCTLTDQLFYISNILSYFIFPIDAYLCKQNEQGVACMTAESDISYFTKLKIMGRGICITVHILILS